MKMVDDDNDDDGERGSVKCDRKREHEIYQNLNETVICIFVANIRITADR